MHAAVGPDRAARAAARASDAARLATDARARRATLIAEADATVADAEPRRRHVRSSDASRDCGDGAQVADRRADDDAAVDDGWSTRLADRCGGLGELDEKEREVVRLRFGLERRRAADAAGDRRPPAPVARARPADRIAREGQAAALERAAAEVASTDGIAESDACDRHYTDHDLARSATIPAGKPVESDGVRRVVRCDCWREQARRAAACRARIPPRYQHCDLDNFRDYNESLERAPSARARALRRRVPGRSTRACSLDGHAGRRQDPSCRRRAEARDPARRAPAACSTTRASCSR